MLLIVSAVGIYKSAANNTINYIGLRSMLVVDKLVRMAQTPFQVAKNWEAATSEECMILKKHVVASTGWNVEPNKLLINCQSWIMGRVIDVSVAGVDMNGTISENSFVLLRISEDGILRMAPNVLQS